MLCKLAVVAHTVQELERFEMAVSATSLATAARTQDALGLDVASAGDRAY